MNDQQIDDAVRECVERINSRDYDVAICIRNLVRRVRDAEQERCAKIGDDRAANWSSFAEQEEREGDPYGDKGPETFSNWEFEAVEYAKAIRAPRTEEKR